MKTRQLLNIITEKLEDKELPDQYFDAKQLAIGTKVEMEHTDNTAIARKIAKDHLAEDPDYYTKLKSLGL